jgi:hypothetical protein
MQESRNYRTCMNTPPEPSHEEISEYAYLAWQHADRPDDRDWEFWFQAESQLLAARAHDYWTRDKKEHSPEPRE